MTKMNSKLLVTLIVGASLGAAIPAAAQNSDAAFKKTTSLIADELTMTPASTVGNCYFATGAAMSVLKDSPQFDEKMQMIFGMQLVVWADVKSRKEANGVVVDSSLAAKMNVPGANSKEIANEIVSESTACTQLFGAAMQATAAKLKSQ
mgnify:CR=1 FL=1